MRRLLLVGGFIASLAWPTLVSAQDSAHSAPEAGVGRTGWLIGLGMFAGNGLESDAQGAAGMGVQIGRMLSPELAVMLDTHGAAVGTSDIGATEVSSTVRVRALAAAAVQWWPRGRLWLRGGVGPARIEGATTSLGLVPGAEIEKARNGVGTTVASGFEVYRSASIAVDLHARYAGIRAGGDGYSSLVAGLGFGWYPNTTSIDTFGEETAPEPKARQWRDRWILGLGALGGRPINNDCSDCYWDAGAGMAFQVGWMVTPRLALMMDTHGVAVGDSRLQGFEEDGNALVQGVVAVALQYWAAQRVFLQGGIGGGEVRASATVTSDNGASVDVTETETGLGTLAAVGYEFYQGESFGWNVQARYAGIHGDALSRASLLLGVGVGWYP